MLGVLVKKGFSFQLKEIIRYCNPIMFILETKVQPKKGRKIIRTFNYPNFIQIPHEGLSGGIWLLWRFSNNFSLQMVSTSTSLYMV